MRTLKRIIYCSTLLYSLSAYSQLQQPNNSTLQDLAFFIDINNSKYANAEGSKYIFKEFKLAKIEGLGGSHLVRFDPVDNIIQLKKEENKILSLSKKYHYKIDLLDGSGRYETQQYINGDGNIENSFFERRYTSPKFSLFKKQRIKFQPAKPAKSSYEPETPAKFIKLDDTYYLMNQANNLEHLIEIPKKKKAILKFFGEKSSEVNKFIKTLKLKTDSEEELIKILEYYFRITSKR